MRALKILVCGLPGAGKTYLASRLASALNGVHFNADEVRATISKDLSFTPADRLIQAERMSAMCDIVKRAGHYAVADFVCPTEATRQAFNADYVIWVNTIKAGRFDDTNALFEPLAGADLVITDYGYTVEQLMTALHAHEQ